jgi:hypothetical protein
MMQVAGSRKENYEVNIFACIINIKQERMINHRFKRLMHRLTQIFLIELYTQFVMMIKSVLICGDICAICG